MTLVCVLGSGIIGLASATALVEAGFEVVVVARDLPGDPGGLAWASPSAGAVIQPLPEGEGHDLQVESLKYYWALAHRDPTAGAQTLPVTEYYDSYEDDSSHWYRSVCPRYRRLRKDELPEGVTVGVTMTTVMVNTTIFLPWLQKNLESRGVKFIRHAATSIPEVLEKTQAAVIVNATGLGAGKLCNDAAVHPVKGQTMFLRNDTEWNEILLRKGTEYTYVIPRTATGGVILGGIRLDGDIDDKPDPTVQRDILRRVNKLTKGAFEHVNIETDVDDIVGVRPGRKGGYRLETEGSRVVHAYGFDGMGYVCSFGAAKRVTELVKELVPPESKL
ncbi:putative FAD dependent oxidoreductase [Pleurostoma richardsiae]|uniref:FAD dependent oxidoreductase n=1 Tax=Pleurostoma richardsiae TaxID=41990 RepID=A0AA38VE30_9PEZI|nr:putative FAD dependent oxidoreductase [Pleurostoma richardsiae]